MDETSGDGRFHNNLPLNNITPAAFGWEFERENPTRKEKLPKFCRRINKKGNQQRY
jgi:hypothetical protein